MRILLIKLGALGDVLRTTPLLAGLRKKYASARIHWLVAPENREVLRGNPIIERLWVLGEEGALARETYDLAINLDKEPEALDAVMSADAGKKMGFGRAADGTLCALDGKSEYARRLGLDDELKFRLNQKTYQEISFEQAGLVFQKEEYLMPMDAETLSFAKNFLEAAGVLRWKRPVIGLNTGSGSRFAGKRLPVSAFTLLAERLHGELGATVLLLGGKDEIERNRAIQSIASCPVVNTGSHPIRRFAGIVKECDAVLSGDTTAMHVAIAMKVPVVAYFASTCASEIELYGRGRKIVSSIACSPCYKKTCPIDERCMKDMSPGELFGAVREVLKGAP
ncbi:MAG: glycosyltransferase family 9 protein [Candidatus Omnitrophica bacterium]|nr:glycosyltransferase family 9 protein [Candidatus Omnitrophota bacterium]